MSIRDNVSMFYNAKSNLLKSKGFTNEEIENEIDRVINEIRQSCQ